MNAKNKNMKTMTTRAMSIILLLLSSPLVVAFVVRNPVLIPSSHYVHDSSRTIAVTVTPTRSCWKNTNQMISLIQSSSSLSSPCVLGAVSNPNDNNNNIGDYESSFFSRLSNPFSASEEALTLDNRSSMSSSRGSTTLLPPGLSAIQSFVEPIQDTLDDSSEFILSYADLRPDSSLTIPGQAFLATNLFYAVTGIAVAMQGDLYFGFLVELCAIASFGYHYTQLEARGETKAPAVRLAVLVDYVCAFFSLSTALIYLLMGLTDASVETFVACALAIGFLFLSWIYETGRPYMFFHSLWHIFGAYGGFLIGSLHSRVELPSLF